MAFSLYVHIPWCQAKCPYCDFNSYAAASWPEKDYTRALIVEMGRRAEEAPWLGERVKTIFFGGGTPSLFKPESIGAVIEATDLRWGIESGAEITLEANPGTVDESKLAGMRAAGVNRISFGAQSFKDETLKFLGRIHNAGQTRAAVEMAHRAGFERLNLDLIFAVPTQTGDDVLRDIAAAVELGPDHISAYNLTFEEGTAFFAEMRRGRIVPLDSDEQAAMYAMVRRELPARGYPRYEISNYAPRGHEARHNLSYWRAENYLGLGAGAHSFARQGGASGRRWWNEKIPARYVAKVKARGRGEAGDETVSDRCAAGEFVFLNLRLKEGFARDDFNARFDTFDSLFGEQAARLINDGLLADNGGRIALTERGLELADSVFAEFV